MTNPIDSINILSSNAYAIKQNNSNPVAFRGGATLEKTPQTDSYEKKRHTGRNITLGSIGAIAVAGLIDQFVFKGKYRTKLFEFTQTNWKKLVEKFTKKSSEQKPPTPPATATKPPTEITANTVTKRKKIKKAKIDNGTTVTPEQQAKYDKEIAYQPLSKEQSSTKTGLDKQNAAQRRELNSIGSLTGKKAQVKAATTPKTRKADGAYLHPHTGNIYYLKDGKITQIRLKDKGGRASNTINDPKKIAKHLAKWDISFKDLQATKRK